MKQSLLFAILLACVCVPARSAEEPAQTHEAGDDRFVGGGVARVEQPVAGDLFVAGGQVEIAASVGGDAVAIGGEVRVEAPVGQDLYAGGGRVSLASDVRHNARIAGGDLRISPQGRIDGNLTAAGGQVEIRGTVGGYLQSAGGRVYLDGAVGGDVQATGGEVALGPNARVGGKLRYASGAQLVRDPAAQVIGGIERIGEDMPTLGGAGRWLLRVVCWVWTFGLMVLAAVLVLALPAFFARVTETARARPAVSLLLGFAALVCVPIAAVLLLITGVGIPLGILMLLAFAASLQVGFIAACVALGDTVLGWIKPGQPATASWRAGAAALSILLVALLSSVPVAGVLVALLVLLVGMGALLLRLYSGATRGATEGAQPK